MFREYLPSRRQLGIALAAPDGLGVGPGKGICFGIAELSIPETTLVPDTRPNSVHPTRLHWKGSDAHQTQLH